MPFTTDAPPDAIKALPKPAQAIWISAFNSAFRAFEGDVAAKEAMALKVAWAAVAKRYAQNEEGKWVERAVSKRSFVAGDRIVVEMNRGLEGGYTAISYQEVDGGLGVFMNEGSAPDGVREAAALYFLMSSGWDVARAVKWARDWAAGRGEVVKRVGVESDDDDGLPPGHFAPIHRGRLAKSVADPALAAKHIGFAVVMEPWAVDVQGSIYTSEEVEKAAHGYMNSQAVGIMHAEWGDVGSVVESFITREGDPDFDTPGSWVMGIAFTDQAWHKILNNELTGLSIGGKGEEEDIFAAAVAQAA